MVDLHQQQSPVAPDWPTGIAPDALIRRPVGILVIAIGACYFWSGLG
jgi:hypothetical protein